MNTFFTEQYRTTFFGITDQAIFASIKSIKCKTSLFFLLATIIFIEIVFWMMQHTALLKRTDKFENISSYHVKSVRI